MASSPPSPTPSSQIQPPIDQILPHSSAATHQDQVAVAAAPTVEANEESKPQLLDTLQDDDAAELLEKLKKYEVAYARRLKAKYFSKKAFNGGDIFDQETTIDNEIIRSSRWPCTRSFADPMQTVEDENRSSPSAAETSGTPSKKTPSKKSC